MRHDASAGGPRADLASRPREACDRKRLRAVMLPWVTKARTDPHAEAQGRSTEPDVPGPLDKSADHHCPHADRHPKFKSAADERARVSRGQGIVEKATDTDFHPAAKMFTGSASNTSRHNDQKELATWRIATADGWQTCLARAADTDPTVGD